ncbi:hypothetical protein KUV51_01435 [Tateyamaria omphalii]|uniref:calcium-binding protein n=1 Tax=Tateyamaria omphalii TaxID=299262 RepID=UPI001C996F26|nr:hypothetical protein [Tateyamaria omphalii]MBY5931645.1 hypothetical protein [Tateyamaria omphalii]
MSAIALLALFGGALMLTAAQEGDGDAPDPTAEDPEVPQDPVEDPVPMDTGATFDAGADGVRIDVGEDETGTLATIIYADTEDDPDNFVETYEARYYLVPEGVDWSGATWETQNEVPGLDVFPGGAFSYELADFEEQFGLELLGTVALEPDGFATFPTQGEMDAPLPELTANRPVDLYYLEANTDGDELITFLPEDFVVTRNGVPATEVDEDTVGTADTDWFEATTGGITIDGAGGDDILTTNIADVTLNGGAGDDTIEGGADITADGGDGNDSINIESGSVIGGLGDDTIDLLGGTAEGGEGADVLRSYTDAEATLFGNAGDDRLSVSGDGSEAHGGDGDDFVGVDTAAASGFGGAGNDTLQLDSGAFGDGGTGDDLFTVWNQFRDEDGPATVTTGDGEDTISAMVWNPLNGRAEDVYLSVTDFDPAEDVLMVGVFQTQDVAVDEVDIVEASDGSFTDVEVTYTPRSGQDPGIAVIRLVGTTGMTADQVMIVA